MKNNNKFLGIIVLAAIFTVITILTVYAKHRRTPTFSLSTNFNEYPNGELSAGLFEEIINGFSPAVWDFMVLSANKPINESTFIQVGAPEVIVDFQYTLEIGFNNWKSGLKMYRFYTRDKDIVLQHFIDYWQEQKTPDISLWEDVSDEML